MRQLFKRLCHAAAFIVNEDERHFIRMIIDRQRQNICHDEFTLARTGHTGDKSVRTVEFLMQIECEQTAVFVDTHFRCKRAGRVMLVPAAEHV